MGKAHEQGDRNEIYQVNQGDRKIEVLEKLGIVDR